MWKSSLKGMLWHHSFIDRQHNEGLKCRKETRQPPPEPVGSQRFGLLCCLWRCSAKTFSSSAAAPTCQRSMGTVAQMVWPKTNSCHFEPGTSVPAISKHNSWSVRHVLGASVTPNVKPHTLIPVEGLGVKVKMEAPNGRTPRWLPQIYWRWKANNHCSMIAGQKWYEVSDVFIQICRIFMMWWVRQPPTPCSTLCDANHQLKHKKTFRVAF